jgi:hypothetical protein
VLRLHAFVVAGVVVLGGGCTRATFGFRPSLTSQVPDGAAVRVRSQNGQPSITGQALDWQVGRLRVITSAGDTVVVPQAATLEVRLKEKKTHATLGAVVGLGVALSIKLVQCPPTNYCAPDLTPLLTAGVGALVGSRFTAVEWARVRRPSAAPCRLQPPLGGRPRCEAFPAEAFSSPQQRNQHGRAIQEGVRNGERNHPAKSEIQ